MDGIFEGDISFFSRSLMNWDFGVCDGICRF